MNTRIELMRAYKERTDREAIEKEEAANRRQTELENKVMALKPRIQTLLETANEANKCGIVLNFGYSLYGRKSADFVCDGVYHHLGFYVRQHFGKNTELKYVGFKNGGACGCWDFVTNGDIVFAWHSDDRDRKSTARQEDMIRFLDEFDAFEQEFYSYIDRIILEKE